MVRVARWSVRNPWRVVGLWAVVLVVVGILGIGFGGKLNDSFELPDTESTTALNLVDEHFGEAANQDGVRVVFAPASGTIADAAVQASVTKLAGQLRALGSVESVTTPYDDAAAAKAQGLVSARQDVGVLAVTFKGADLDVPKADVVALVGDVKAANTAALQVGASGQVLDLATEVPSSELIGVLLALVILVLTFGSLVAAGMPIVSALLSLGAGTLLVTFVARFTDVATFAPTISAMIGLGVGIDYALFIINRYRQAHEVGRTPEAAAVEAVNTAGRAVLFAGTTVIVSLLGLFVLRINLINGIAVASAVTVLMVMLSAVTLLPAVLRLLGHRVFALKMPWARNRTPHPEGGGFARYGRRLQRRPWLYGAVALVGLVALASPVLSLQQGFPDASGRPEGDVQRTAYDLTARGFGPGANGPLLVVATLPSSADLATATALAAALAKTPGVAYASPPTPSPDGAAALIQVLPTTGPQDEATGELLQRIRTETVPAATAGGGVRAYVGGTTAILDDFSTVLADALPLFLVIVVGVGFLLLVVLFRSLVVPLTAALTSLLSFGAALGATVAVFQWGHLAGLLGVSGTGPIIPFLPVMLYAILFGLSMDYQVFLVSRMQEEWTRTGDNRLSVLRGLAGSGRVVAVAAAIMTSVFASFVIADNQTVKMMGLALAVAIVVDAFVVRLVLVPCLMTVLGRANWYLPSWLADRLPAVHVETEEEAAEIVDVAAEDEGAARARR